MIMIMVMAIVPTILRKLEFLQRIRNRVVRRMLGEICEPQQRTSLIWEHAWNPAKWIIKVPYRHANTTFHTQTGLYRSPIIQSLLSEVG